MKKAIVTFLILLCGLTLQLQGQISFEADFTDTTQARRAIHHPLDIYNRISPITGFASPVTENAKLCIVRPLGGKYKDGSANISEDTYLWDEEQQTFFTDFTLLKKQIDGVFNKGFGIHQIVLDNPSWAFQRDSLGNLEGGSLKVSTYGNAEPPRDFNAWADYLKEVMNFLISTYGEQEMLKIQFGIGREIGTEGHWTGTKEQFFDFYRKSVAAIHEVLPEAKVGSHFLWGSSSKSWAVDFVKWCKTNNVDYDQLGVSYYPFYNQISRTYFPQVYNTDFGLIKDIPEWNENAVFEIHEYALIETMNSQGNGYESAAAKYQNSFLVGLMKMFFENDMKNLFQWGTGTQYMPASTEILKMKGNIYYQSTTSDDQILNMYFVDAIFAKDTVQHKYNVMVYNYNANPLSNGIINATVQATIDAPPGTNIKYRSAVYNKADGTLPWSSWQFATTEGSFSNVSTIRFNEQLPVFSFLKYEFLVTDEEPEEIDSASMVDKLIFYYPLENNGMDASKNKNHATLGSAVTFSSGKEGQGASFSYTEGSFLTSADSVFKYSYPTAYTIAFWLKVSDYSQRGDILQPAGGRTLLYSNGDLSFRTFHQKQSVSFSVSEEEKDEWFHVAMVIDQREGQTQHKFYVNGVPRGSVADGYLLETDKPQSIGRLIFGASSDEQLQRNFSGMLDEIYLFDDVLSEMEIDFLMNSKGLIDYTSVNTGIHNMNRKDNIKLFPIPANSILNISGVNAIDAGVYDLSGALLKIYNVTNNQLDVTSLRKGMYLLKISDINGREAIKRFMIR